LLELGSQRGGRKWWVAFSNCFSCSLELESCCQLVIIGWTHGVKLRVLFKISFIYSVVTIAVRVPGDSRAPRQAERQLPSPESCYERCEVSLPCDTQVLNCTRI
jgi:hypothetical protein